MEFLPTVSKETLEATKGDDWDFLFTVIEPYQDAIEEAEEEGDVLDQLTDDQYTLLIYNALYGQVTNGGFLQLIHNGYGQFVFQSLFIDNLEKWSLEKTARLLRQAQTIYNEHRSLLEQERTLEEFSDLYKTFTAFEPLDEAFYGLMEEETRLFREYIEAHLTTFVKIV